MVTLAQIGREAGVSAATVSAVLNPSRQTTRVSPAVATKIREIAERLGYAPNHAARVLRSGKADAIAVTIGTADGSVLTSHYFSSLLAGVDATLRKAGRLAVIVGPLGEEHAQARTLRGLRERQFDSAILLCGLLEELEGQDAKVVRFERGRGGAFPVIDWDLPAAADLALGHLAQLGHRRVCSLMPVHQPQDEGADRDAALREAATRHGITIDTVRFPACAATIETAAEALAAALPGRAWTAVVAYNDQAGIGATRALHRAGVAIPAQVSVVGIDDVEAELAWPPLTSVSHELAEMGRRAAELAMTLADGAELKPGTFLVAPRLVVRASTGPAPA